MRVLNWVLRGVVLFLLAYAALSLVSMVWGVLIAFATRALLWLVAGGAAYVSFRAWSTSRGLATMALLTAVIAGFGAWQGWSPLGTAIMLAIGLVLSSVVQSKTGAMAG